MLQRGDRIGRYTIDRLLGEGGMGAAFLAHHEAIAGFKKKVVVKVLQADKAMDPVNVELFLREARVGGRLNHTGIVQIFDIGEERGAHFMAMEFVDGMTLLQVTRRCWALGHGVPIEIALRVIGAASEALHYAHTFKLHDGREAGVVHRDLSPDNLMIAREGTVKILDFGVARIGGSEATKSGDLKGKIPYMPPEQLKGDVDIDARADLYALGVTLYWCLAGRRPFVGDIGSMMRAIAKEPPPHVRDFNANVSEELAAIVMTLLEKDRNKRIATAAELSTRLLHLVKNPRDEMLARVVQRLMTLNDAPPEASKALLQGRPATPGDMVSMHPSLVGTLRPDGQSHGRVEGEAEPAVITVTTSMTSELVPTSSSMPISRSTTTRSADIRQSREQQASTQPLSPVSVGAHNALADITQDNAALPVDDASMQTVRLPTRAPAPIAAMRALWLVLGVAAVSCVALAAAMYFARAP